MSRQRLHISLTPSCGVTLCGRSCAIRTTTHAIWLGRVPRDGWPICRRCARLALRYVAISLRIKIPKEWAIGGALTAVGACE